jgi:hypothetical protein
MLQGQMLAALLSWPQATFASKVELDQAAGSVKVRRGEGVRPGCLLLPPGEEVALAQTARVLHSIMSSAAAQFHTATACHSWYRRITTAHVLLPQVV